MTFFDLTFKKPEIQKPHLEWYVIVEDFNGKEMVPYNIFDHNAFMNDLINITKKLNKKFKDGSTTLVDIIFSEFEEEVRKSLSYYYWSKSEWEFVATTFPPYIENEQIDELVEERKDHLEKYGYFYRTSINLNVGSKLDVYTQVRMNWKPFINYLWDNIKLIKKKKIIKKES